MTTKTDNADVEKTHDGAKTAGSSIDQLLREKGIVPTRQRIEIAQVLLEKHQHLSADQLQARLAEGGGFVPSRATVYNTLRLFADHGLIREVVVDPQRVFFDSNIGPHHHYFDVEHSELSDIPAGSLQVTGLPPLPSGLVCEDIEVIVRIRRY
jgi:Fur family iron response transcriptional regulator